MSSGARNAAATNARAMADFRKRLEGLLGDFDESARRIVDRMAAVGMAETVKNTPVGVYSPEVSFVTKTGKVVHFTTGIAKQGGTLRRGWVKSITRKASKSWVGGYANPVSYAMYVNEGHRVVSQGTTVGYVPGKHMLEIGTRAAEKSLPNLLNAEIARIKRKSGF